MLPHWEVKKLRARIGELEKENEELRREKSEFVDLMMKGEAVRSRAILDLILMLPAKGTENVG